jgi:hypothetical protein
MQLSKLLQSATEAFNALPPSRLSAAAAALIAFLLSLVLLRNTLAEAAASSQMLVASLGGLIAAFLSSRLAAYLVRLAELWAGWPGLSRTWQLLMALILALAAAALVLALMLLVS